VAVKRKATTLTLSEVDNFHSRSTASEFRRTAGRIQSGVRPAETPPVLTNIHSAWLRRRLAERAWRSQTQGRIIGISPVSRSATTPPKPGPSREARRNVRLLFQ